MEINNYNWNASISSILNAAGVDDVTATGEINDAGKLVLTVTTKDGKTSTVTIDPPELDEATMELTDEAKEELAQKLSELSGETINLDLLLENPTVAKLFFDMMSLMKLLQQIAQEQKNNLRMQRENELQIEIGSIEAQAEQQRNAAKAALITSCVSMAMQVASIGASIGITAGATKAQNQAMNDAGLGLAKNDLKMTMEAVDNPEVAAEYAAKTQEELTPEQKQQLDKEYNGLGLGLGESDADVVAKLDSFCEKADTDVLLARSNLDTAKGELAQLSPDSPDYPAAVQKVADAETRLEGAEKMQRAVHMNAIATKHAYGLTDSLKADVAKAKGKVDAIQQSVEMSDAWRSSFNAQRQVAYLDQSMMALRGVCDGLSNMLKTEYEAKATEKSAEQKEAEGRYSELSDMMKSAQDVISSMIQLYQSILSAESQSLEQVIRA